METLQFAVVLLLELVPLFLLVSAGVYLAVEALTPERMQELLSRRGEWWSVPLASLLGAVAPFCSCSTVPVVNGMRRAGITAGPVVSFLIASPLIHPVAVALLWVEIGAEYALLYTVSALAIAMGGAVLVGAWDRAAAWSAGGRRRARARRVGSTRGAVADGRTGTAGRDGGGARGCEDGCTVSAPAEPAGKAGVARRPFGPRVREAFRSSWADLRQLALPLVAAVGAGALIHGYVPSDLLARLAGPEALWAVPLAAVLGVPVYASIVVLLPLGTTLLAKGVGLGAVTAFLMGAAGFSLPEGILLSRVLPKRLLVRVLAVFSTGVIVIGYLVQWLTG